MVKRNAVCALIAALVALLLPWLAVTLVRGDGGMAVCFLLFFAVNPVTAILLAFFPAEISVGHGSSRCCLPRCSCWEHGCSLPWLKRLLCAMP